MVTLRLRPDRRGPDDDEYEVRCTVDVDASGNEEDQNNPRTTMTSIYLTRVFGGSARGYEIAFDERNAKQEAIHDRDFCINVADVPALIRGLQWMIAGDLGRLAIEAERDNAERTHEG